MTPHIIQSHHRLDPIPKGDSPTHITEVWDGADGCCWFGITASWILGGEVPAHEIFVELTVVVLGVTAEVLCFGGEVDRVEVVAHVHPAH